MKRKIRYSYLSVLMGVCLAYLCLASCSVVEEEKVFLGEREFCFDDKLTSLSVAPGDKFWIGTERGDVILFDETVGITRRWNLADGSIYKVASRITEAGDTTLYLGIRNGGLQICRINGSALSRTSFSIPVRGRFYSVYDFEFSGDSLYVATSNGLYCLSPGQKSTQLRLLLPSAKELERHSGEYQIHNIEIAGQQRTLVCSSPDGVKHYGLDNGKIKSDLPGRSVNYVCSEGDSLLILSQGDLFVRNLGLSYAYRGHNNPQVYFRDARNNVWLIASDRIRIGRNLSDNFEEIFLRSTIPVHSGNIIVSGRDHTFLIVEDALWKIPQNINIYQSHRNISAVCRVDKSVYLTTNRNQLYRYDPEQRRAVSLGTLPFGSLVQWMDTGGDKLYLHTQTELYRVDLHRLNRRWRLQNIKCDRIFVSSDPILSAAITRLPRRVDRRIFLGTRRALLYLDESGQVSPALENEYVISISQDTVDVGMPVYVTTLNHGVYKTENTYDGGQGNFKPAASLGADRAVLRLGFTPGAPSCGYMLTSSGLYTSVDSLLVRGIYDMTVVNDTMIVLTGHRGVRMVAINRGKIDSVRSMYHDVKFKPAGPLVLGDSLLMFASDIGALVLPVKHPETPVWIGFVDYQLHESLILMGLFILGSGLVGVFFYRHFHRQSRKNRTVELAERRQYLQEKIAYLEGVVEEIPCCNPSLVQDLQELRQALAEQSDNLEYNKLNEFSATFYDLYHRVLTLFRNEIKEQYNLLRSIENVEAVQLLSALKDASEGGDLAIMQEHTARSRDWLNRYNQLSEQIERALDQWSDCAPVPGINENLTTDLQALKRRLTIDPIDQLLQRYQGINNQICQIESAASRNLIFAGIQSEVDRLKDDVSYLPIVNLLKKMSDAQGVCNRDILRSFARIAANGAICRTIGAIRVQLTNYLCHNPDAALLSERERMIVDKAATEIRLHIDSFYQLLPASEAEILFGLFPSKGGLTLPNKIIVLLFADKNIANKHLQALLQNYRDLRFDKSRVLSLVREFVQGYESPTPVSSVVVELLIHIAN